jgi:branched-chain amino acid transport system permease protein
MTNASAPGARDAAAAAEATPGPAGVAGSSQDPATPAGPSALPGTALDWKPIALVIVLALAALPLVGSPSTWLTLTVAGLAMGMIIFIIASGLTLVFGLMDVLNFGHGVFIAAGAFIATSVMAPLAPWTQLDHLGWNLAAVFAAMLVAMAACAALGVVFERLLVRPVYGQHLKQILITMGGMIVGEELIKVLWGPQQIPLPLPQALRGSVLLGDAAIERYRLFAVAVGLVVLLAMGWVLARTKLGLLIRAGVQDREMVEALGYRIRRLFVGVFVAGSGLAGLGGVLWGLYQQGVVPQIGAQVNVLLFIVIIIGGLGSTLGCFVGALLVGLMANYTGFLVPKVALFSNIVLMVAILLWRPQGVYPVANR